jgi:hypothetical protein
MHVLHYISASTCLLTFNIVLCATSVSIAPTMTNVADVSAQEDIPVFVSAQYSLRPIIDLGIRLHDHTFELAHTGATNVAERMN